MAPASDMAALVRELWAWFVSAMALAGSWLADLDHWLALMALVVACLTAWERLLVIQVRKRQLAENNGE